MTRAVFAAQMARLNGLRFVPADMTTHWEALQDLPLDIIERAVTWAQRTRVEFPTPVDLLRDADTAQTATRTPWADEDRRTPLAAETVVGRLPNGTVIRATHEWRYDCDVCGDGGWEACWCGGDTPAAPWQALAACGRFRCARDEARPHEWVRRCQCASHNPTIQRRMTRAATYAPPTSTRRGAA